MDTQIYTTGLKQDHIFFGDVIKLNCKRKKSILQPDNFQLSKCMAQPEISIVMPVFNSERFVEEAVKSILGQTFNDFEFIIVDDGSTDGSLEILESFHDSRIRILKNKKNRGIVYSRNRGLSEIKGRYYAPFDSDDVADSLKFEKQINFLSKNPYMGLVGSWTRLMDENGKFAHEHWKLKAKSEQIPPIMLFRNYFVHSSMLVRRNAIPVHQYVEGLDVVEDYRFCFDIALHHPVWNLPEYLLNYRIHHNSAMRCDDSRMQSQDEKMYKYIFELLEIELTEQQLDCIFAIKGHDQINDLALFEEIHALLILILEQNNKLRVFNHHQLEKTVVNRWLKVYSLSKKKHLKMLKKMISSSLTKKYFRI